MELMEAVRHASTKEELAEERGNRQEHKHSALPCYKLRWRLYPHNSIKEDSCYILTIGFLCQLRFNLKTMRVGFVVG
jgi:hypothetical protein